MTCEKNRCLGVELGSTRIKAVAIDAAFRPVSDGSYTWSSKLDEGIWTYDMALVWEGLRAAIGNIDRREDIAAMGVSAMMHGYLAFDENWKLLVPFRTWQNTMTGDAAGKLTELFGFNIPQRWSIAHLYQAALNGEPHVNDVAHITTLAGYVHFMLTGENVIGIGEASGMFPIDSATHDYNIAMLRDFDALGVLKRPLSTYLPKVLVAGAHAGRLTEKGAELLNGLLSAGIPFAPPEGDAGTGMTATNAVAERTGNVSAGTSIFSMVVLEKPLERVYPEIDMVTTPTGRPVAMVHCNNCTSDINAWAGALCEAAALFCNKPDADELYTRLYEKSLEGDADCGGVVVVNYIAGEGVTHFDEGRPMVIKLPNCRFTLANFIRAQLYSTMATLSIGMDILRGENVAIDILSAHGGLFKTPLVGQKYLAAACRAPVTCMETAGEGGPYGMALLAAFMRTRSGEETLEEWLSDRVFANTVSATVKPDAEDAAGFEAYVKRFEAALAVERAAIKQI